jgi:hypothetical protein
VTANVTGAAGTYTGEALTLATIEPIPGLLNIQGNYLASNNTSLCFGNGLVEYGNQFGNDGIILSGNTLHQIASTTYTYNSILCGNGANRVGPTVQLVNTILSGGAKNKLTIAAGAGSVSISASWSTTNTSATTFAFNATKSTP